MKRIKNYGLVIAAFGAFTVSGHAQTVPTCVPGTLAAYSGVSCTFAGKDWSFNGETDFITGGTNPVDTPSNIFLTPIAGGFTFTQVDDFGVTTPFGVAAGDTAFYDIIYFDPTTLQTGASLDMDPPSGTVSINQYYCANSTATPTLSSANSTPICLNDAGAGFAPQVLHVDDTNPPASWTTTLLLNPSFTNAFAVTQILLGDGVHAGGFDSVSAFTSPDASTSTPEPVSILLMGGGLISIALRRCLTRP